MKDKKAYLLIGMSFELVAIIFTSLYVGNYVDERYSLGGVAMISFTMGGFIGWLVHLMVFINNKKHEGS